jgi:hypothetical protein
METPPATTPPSPAPTSTQSTENNPPVIETIEAQQPVSPLDSVQVRCIASDPDGDTLFYSWTPHSGSIDGQGDTITWTAPDTPGNYDISATVRDGRGAEVTDSLTIVVSTVINQPATISMIVTPKSGPRISDSSSDEPIDVTRWSTSTIECLAIDPEGGDLQFAWSTTGGKIQGEGTTIQYIATTTGNHSVTVVVTDSTGRETVGTVYFYIPCCKG